MRIQYYSLSNFFETTLSLDKTYEECGASVCVGIMWKIFEAITKNERKPVFWLLGLGSVKLGYEKKAEGKQREISDCKEIENILISKIEGCYRHFKGNNYEVLGKAYDLDTNEEFVFYQQLYPPFQYWIRPKEMFFGEKIFNNKAIKRFIRIEDSQKDILTNIDIYSINISHTETRKLYKIKCKVEDNYMIVKK